MANPAPGAEVIKVDGADKSFGAVRAIKNVSFSVAAGECVGLVGHNGAGKSTLVNIINGGLAADSGTVRVEGMVLGGHHTIATARDHGVRSVFQELSLCPNLTVTENTHIAHASLNGWGWRRRAEAMIRAKLAEIFPGNSIDCRRMVGELSIAERQMVEIAMAFSETGAQARLVILDEPTSSLDASLATQLLGYVRSFVASGGAVVLVSHILGEILAASTRVVVMKDGAIVAARPAGEFTIPTLVAAMGSVARERDRRVTAPATSGALVLSEPGVAGSIAFAANAGEMIGLAGLAGHGQTRMLVGLFMTQGGDWRARRDQKVVFVAGDRFVDGTFPRWSILKNLTVSLLRDLSRFTLLRLAGERQVADDWKLRIGIRTEDLDNPILSLSGGNQQKVLFARALATRSPVVLMDDPMRGVDIGTKQEVHALLRAETDKGRTFVWYSTEMDELCQCDRVYVFREGKIVGELRGDDVAEAQVLAASFAGAVA